MLGYEFGNKELQLSFEQFNIYKIIFTNNDPLTRYIPVLAKIRVKDSQEIYLIKIYLINLS